MELVAWCNEGKGHQANHGKFPSPAERRGGGASTALSSGSQRSSSLINLLSQGKMIINGLDWSKWEEYRDKYKTIHKARLAVRRKQAAEEKRLAEQAERDSP